MVKFPIDFIFEKEFKMQFVKTPRIRLFPQHIVSRNIQGFFFIERAYYRGNEKLSTTMANNSELYKYNNSKSSLGPFGRLVGLLC